MVETPDRQPAGRPGDPRECALGDLKSMGVVERIFELIVSKNYEIVFIFL